MTRMSVLGGEYICCTKHWGSWIRYICEGRGGDEGDVGGVIVVAALWRCLPRGGRRSSAGGFEHRIGYVLLGSLTMRSIILTLSVLLAFRADRFLYSLFSAQGRRSVPKNGQAWPRSRNLNFLLSVGSEGSACLQARQDPPPLWEEPWRSKLTSAFCCGRRWG
jgi:hypothetical protein